MEKLLLIPASSSKQPFFLPVPKVLARAIVQIQDDNIKHLNLCIDKT